MKINQLCWFMENLKSIVVWSVIGAIVVALIILACKSKIALMAELCLICVVIVMSGIYTGFYDIRYFVNKNSIHGESTEGVHNQTLGSYNELTKTFTFTRFGFAPTSEENKYECILEFKDKSLDFTKEENLYVNDEPCDHITKETDYIKADYRQIFLDDENNTLCDDSIYIIVHANKNKLAINLTTKGGDKAVKYWRSFLIENNFKVSFGKNNRPNNTTIDVDSISTIYIMNFDISFEKMAAREYRDYYGKYPIAVIKIYDIKMRETYSFSYEFDENPKQVQQLFTEPGIFKISFVLATGFSVDCSANGGNVSDICIFTLGTDGSINANISVYFY